MNVDSEAGQVAVSGQVPAHLAGGDGDARSANKEQVVPFIARRLNELPAHRRGPRRGERIRAVVNIAGGVHVVELSKGGLVGGIDRLDKGLP